MNISKNSALILVDVQDENKQQSWLKQASKEYIEEREAYHARVKALTSFFRLKRLPIIHVIELHRDDLVDFGRELDGSEKVHCLEKDSVYAECAAPIGGEYLISKRRYSAFFGTDLEILLRGLKTTDLYICGGMTDICVHYTAVEAHQRNYHVHVVAECCSTHSPEGVGQAALDNIEYFQTGSVVSLKDVLGEDYRKFNRGTAFENVGLKKKLAEPFGKDLPLVPDINNGGHSGYAGKFTIPANSALLVIDIQNDMASDKIPIMEKKTDTLGNSKKIIEFFRGKKLPVIQIREVHRADGCDYGRELDGVEGQHCLEGTQAAEFYTETAPAETDYQIIKRRYSAFIGTDLDLLLRCLGVETVFLIGGLTDVCVRFTAVDAHQNDYHFYVVTDAVAGSSVPAHEYALRNMRYLQKDSNITTKNILNAKIK